MGDKRKWGDRKDGIRLKNLDSMHCIMPLIFPKRCESEFYIHERVDLTRANEYIREKNAENPENRYSLFHLIITAILKTMVLRPQLNRFIANQNIYQRKGYSAAFVVKTGLSDDAEEALAFINVEESDNFETIHNMIFDEISACCDENKRNSSERAMDIVAILPAFVKYIIGIVVRWLDRHGKMPQSMIANDMHYASVVLTQLGSIKLNAGYHHLTDWGTNSLFLAMGERKLRPIFDSKGNVTMKSCIDLGITVDERISDGYYFAKSIRLLKRILEHPEVLEQPLNEKL